MDIRNDPRLEQWFELADVTKSTRITYLTYIQAFCDCVNKTPTELISEAIQETKQGLLLSERKTVLYLTKFKKCLENRAPKTQALAMSTVKSFYKAFDIQLSSGIGKSKKRLPLRENQNFLNKEDVKKLVINTKNLRSKAIMLCMATSGMARNEIVNLKIKDIIFDPSGIGIVSIRREKAQVDYTTFISPEATQALKNYFDERNRDPDLKIESDNDFIFVTYEHGKGTGRGEQISKPTFGKGFRDLGRELGYQNGEGLFVKSRSHAFRKFFATTLQTAGMPKYYIDYMLGHTPSGNDLAYFKVDTEKLKELYIKYLPYLTFERTIQIRSLDTEDAKRLAELEKENEVIKADYEELRAKYNDIANDNELSEMRQVLHAFQLREQDTQSRMKSMEEYMKKLIAVMPKDVLDKAEKISEE